MSADSIFERSDYKEIIRLKLEQANEWGEISRLAEAASCQRSYLSKVLNSHVHLTPDHGAGLCRYWGFNFLETEFFMCLLEIARSGSKPYRAYLDEKLNRIRAQWEESSKRQGRTQVLSGEREALYYSGWQWAAIHIGVSIPQLQTAAALSQRLQIPEPLVESILLSLEKLNLIRRDGNRWRYASAQIHIPADSPWVSLHHGNWRQRAIQDSMLGSSSSGLHYTNVQSMTEATFKKIRGLFLKAIDESVQAAGPSKEEELICIVCDVFRV